ncbi:NADPH-dependent 2,4-dienoyl-CoA reductase/sulfur reductase-like enzyme [Amycolatopsis lexingtonensis]|uniref:NADPH-dependent 2,4-dienoyl-CoA reductase/sulfur reductase-like enzyme n=1 Tax=Amycolatopsis lexingtonensis TaxID=218822 RepID=A0ABR9IG01_9PSEU|nr:FAD-dependent oxidoreductase [Amycolatopsis lexingtonensis]MBE1502110.1 NADPH-dependent 2,4-dienoyl-CoA reductase/sulfur reductase-like enzyme [Amycolatopsis lexingtonensis]
MISFVPEPHLLDSPRGREWPRPPVPTPVRGTLPASSADVVVVGAGPAGVAVASALWHHGVRDVVVADRTGRPCGRFFGRIDRLGQRVLRSPYEHHPGVEGYRDCELLDFARLHWGRLTPVERREIRMSQAGHRSVVPVDVFDAYCDHLIASHHIGRKTWQARVREVVPEGDAVTVRADRFSVTARHVVLCLGEERREAPDSWWGGGSAPAGVSYWDESVPVGGRCLAVVGAGLTAAHLIAGALDEGREVHWVVRETGERYQCADVNSSFFRPEGRLRFNRVGWSERLELMSRFRRASIMFEFRPLLERAQAEGRLVVHRGAEVKSIGPGVGGTTVVRLVGGGRIAADHVQLALGTTPSIGEGLLPDEALSVRDGWPELDERTLAHVRAPRVSVVGAAAAMVLGPAARNIDGHRVATTRAAAAIAQVLRGGELPAPAKTAVGV